LDVLLDAMPMMLKEKNVTLLIVGEFWSDKQSYLDKMGRSGISANVRIVDDYVPNEEIGIYFAASDLVVQPYISAWGSAICQIAYKTKEEFSGERMAEISNFRLENCMVSMKNSLKNNSLSQFFA